MQTTLLQTMDSVMSKSICISVPSSPGPHWPVLVWRNQFWVDINFEENNLNLMQCIDLTKNTIVIINCRTIVLPMTRTLSSGLLTHPYSPRPFLRNQRNRVRFFYKKKCVKLYPPLPPSTSHLVPFSKNKSHLEQVQIFLVDSNAISLPLFKNQDHLKM